MESGEGPTGLERLALEHAANLQQVKQVAAGGCAGCVAKTAVAPLSRVTILMQVQSMRPHKFSDGQRPNNRYMLASMRKIVLEEGFCALWRGNAATLAHRFPYTGVTFWCQRALRRRLDDEGGPRIARLPPQARALIAGGCSAGVGVLLCHPLDVVKTRLTAQTKKQYYNGIIDACRRIRLDEGVPGFYRGLGVAFCTTVPMLALNFALFDHFRGVFEPVIGPESPTLIALVSGGSAGACASAMLFPADLLKRQMQMVGLGGRPNVYNNVFQAVRHIFNTGYTRHSDSPFRLLYGSREFFRGLLPELIKVTPNTAILFCVHGWLLSCRWPFEVTQHNPR
eukprot:TRINITY_DN23938_c0_g1_i1.p1 TRINITY_DN23938_c0_g1~~TRINITY_DN23938_c0_g1_i1.p1  ORF type:complete len:339 (-),score=38.31 TRINITY_DN23938_c0_g1_i1:168-1184(-)